MPRYQLSPSLVESLKDELRAWARSLAELCKRTVAVRNESFIKLPTTDHMVHADDNMDKAFHLFVVGRHDSLFVSDGKAIVGVIRSSHVNRKIVHTMRECPLREWEEVRDGWA